MKLNRRVGIAGITVGALFCMLCGIPLVAAILGIGGFSIFTILSEIPAPLKLFIGISSSVIIGLLIVVMLKRSSSSATGSDR